MFSNQEVLNQVLSYLVIAVIVAFPKALFDISKLKQSRINEKEKIRALEEEVLKTEKRLADKIESYKDDTREAFREIKQDIKELNSLIKEMLIKK